MNSGDGVHDFEIPHDKVSPTRDIVVVRVPRPPEKVGNFYIPAQIRDVKQHNTMAGIITTMGALAFAEKHDNGVRKVQVLTKEGPLRDPQPGDWAVFRPFAGTMVMGGELAASFGYRYLSTFNDVIGVIAPEFMPDPATLLWDDKDMAQVEMKFPGASAKPEPLPENVRERVVYKK